MELEQIAALLERFDASSCSLLELERDGLRLRLEKPCAAQAPVPASVSAAAPSPAVPPPKEGKTLNAPLVGTFYAAPGPGKPSFVAPGDRVAKGQTVCILEAMKMLSEVPAPMDGVIEEVLVSDGELVGFDQPLFRYRAG